MNARMKDFETTIKTQGTQIQDLLKQKKDSDDRAERAERHGVIRQAMSKVQFADDRASSTAFMLIEPHIKRGDDGAIIADGNLPVDRFVEEFLRNEHSYLLPSTGTTGSGAANQGTTRGSSNQERADLNDIRPGMTPETRQRALQSIGAALPQRSNR